MHIMRCGPGQREIVCAIFSFEELLCMLLREIVHNILVIPACYEPIALSIYKEVV